MAYTVKIYAHRGLWLWNGPENSVEAFRAAEANGFDSECDVWESADGEAVVIHDETLDRTTTGTGRVGGFNSGDLSGMRCRIEGSSAKFLPLPLLKDVAALVSLVEVKEPDSVGLISRIIEVMAGQRWSLQSFYPANLHHALALSPNLPVSLLIHDLEAIDIALANRWPVHIDQHLLDDRIAGRLADVGLSLGVWTIQTEAELERVMQWRPDVIITDQPVLVRRLLGQWGIQIAPRLRG